MIGTVRTEVGERVLTLDAVVDQVADARAADGERAEFLGVHEHEADARVLGQSGEQTGVARAERLEDGATLELGERDQPEVARREHDDIGRIVRLGRSAT